VTNGLLWSNILLLFTLSLVPFSTAYLGEHHFSREATWLYLATMMGPSIAYAWLQSVIARTGAQGSGAQEYYAASSRKGLAATLIYGAGIPLTLVSPWLGIGCAVVVAILVSAAQPDRSAVRAGRLGVFAGWTSSPPAR
jgi:uncharacterized membrane protein